MLSPVSNLLSRIPVDFTRTLLGFDDLMTMMNRTVVDAAGNLMSTYSKNFPRYNVIDIPNEGFRIEFAVAGFSKNDLEVYLKGKRIVVTGKKVTPESPERNIKYVHHGLTEKSFVKEFLISTEPREIQAHYADGILAVVVTTTQVKEQASKIIIN